MGKTSQTTHLLTANGNQPLVPASPITVVANFTNLEDVSLQAKADPRCDGPPGGLSPQSLSPSSDIPVIFDSSASKTATPLPETFANETPDSPSPTPKTQLTVITHSSSSDSLENLVVDAPGTPTKDDPKAEPGSYSPRLGNTHKKLTAQDKLNFFGRLIEVSRFLGLLPQVVVAEEMPSEGADFDTQIGNMVDKIGGVAIAGIIHLFFRNRYRKVQSLNPLYRNFKTLATAGTEVGLMLADLWLLPQLLATAIFALGIGLLAIPYWLYREYFLRTPPEKRNADYKTGPEGWSKYGKTFLVFGMYFGEVIGSIFAFALQGNFLRNIAIFGAVGSIMSFCAGLVIVPLVNKRFKQVLITDKHRFRNNYIRSGITLGIAVGSIVGFVLGTLVFPGIGSGIGMAVGTAFGSVIGGVALGVYGYRISEYVRVKWCGSPDVNKWDPDNSWDYASRNTSYLFGFAGAAIGFFLPVPGGALMGAAIGSAVASAIGWVAGLVLIRFARKTALIEPKALTLPWTQRIANGSMIGSMIGAALGFGFGFIGGPAGAIMGATLGFSAGAIVGGLVYGLYDKMARRLITAFFKGETVDVETASPTERERLVEAAPKPELVKTPEPDKTSEIELSHAKVAEILAAEELKPAMASSSSPTRSPAFSSASPVPSTSPDSTPSPSPPASPPLQATVIPVSMQHSHKRNFTFQDRRSPTSCAFYRISPTSNIDKDELNLDKDDLSPVSETIQLVDFTDSDNSRLIFT